MKIALAQIAPIKGAIAPNKAKHLAAIQAAAAEKCAAIFFPELSLTSYEPTLAATLAMPFDAPQLADFQMISDEKEITIGIGLPSRLADGIGISFVLFQPKKERQAYTKRYLHADEKPYFKAGKEAVMIKIGAHKIALAICYEVFIPAHAEEAVQAGATLYVASVAKAEKGIQKAYPRLAEIAKKYKIAALMVNCIGYCDNFEAAGQSAAWNANGALIQQLEAKQEGLLIVDLA